MRKTLILAAVAAFAFTSVANAKMCTDPKTHHFMKCAPATVTTTTTTTVKHPSGKVVTASTTTKAKVCKKGKPCGNSCISMKDTCHK